MHLEDLGKVGHTGQSQHFAGTAFDVGQGWTNAKRATLRTSARNSGLWNYVEPVSISPQIKQGSLSVYVLIAQDDLNTLGFSTGSLDGIFGTKTKSAVIRYQRSRGLTADGIIGCNTWRSLQENVVGTGRTSTTLD